MARRDLKQRSIKSFCVKVPPKPEEVDKENLNIDLIQSEPSPSYQLDERQTIHNSNSQPESGLTCPVPGAMILYDEEPSIETETHYRKPAMIVTSQPGCWPTETKSREIEPTWNGNTSPPTTGVLDDTLGLGFCPKHTSTQIYHMLPDSGQINTEDSSVLLDYSYNEVKPTEDPHYVRRPGNTYTAIQNQNNSTVGMCCDNTCCYSLSMRFTQDSLGNPIFCRLSQKH